MTWCRCCSANQSAYGKLEVINADILEFDLASLGEDKKFRLVGNLPYNISTPLMFHMLESMAQIEDMHFMVQKEVALRIVAGPGNGNYGRLSVMLQYRCECQYLFDVAPGSFSPPPKVDSAVVRMIPLAEPEHDIGDEETSPQSCRQLSVSAEKPFQIHLKPWSAESR